MKVDILLEMLSLLVLSGLCPMTLLAQTQFSEPVPIRGPPFETNDENPLSSQQQSDLERHFQAKTHPFFTWHESQGNTIPTMRVHYGINDTDRISLYPHDAMPDVEDHKKPLCNYLGRLEHDSRATVAVTGCQGTGETEITLLSSRSMGSYLFNDSNVEEIPVALPHGEEDRMSIDLPQASDWILLEGDEMLLIPKEKKVMHMEQICPAGECKDIPPYHELTVQVGYDSTFAAKVPNIEEWISKVLAHTQAHFYHPSLLAQIRLKVIGTPKSFPDQVWRATTDDIKRAREQILGKTEANVYVLFCNDPEYFGTVGIAFVGGICSSSGLQLSINEWRKTIAASAKVVAHEIGHNLGMNHDFTAKYKARGCTGIMDYGDSPDVWSKCSQEDFRNNYRVQMSRTGKHCMATLESAPDDGSFVPPSLPEPETEKLPTNDGKFSCPAPLWKGDGFCDDMNNIADCDFDAGDCCNKTKPSWNAFCQKCQCHTVKIGVNQTTNNNFNAACPSPHFRGDGFCDDANNIPACDFDGGDCCRRGKNWNVFCIECRCKNKP